MNTKVFTILALAAMVTAMPSATVPESATAAQEFHVTGYTTGEQYGMAKAAVTALLQEGKDDSACRDLAKTTADEVTNSVNAQQKTLEALPNGGQCGSEGQDLINTATKAETDAKQAKTDAASALSAAEDEKFNFGDFSYTQLTEGQCGTFFNSDVWKNAKTKVQAAQTAYNNAESAVTTATTNVATAKKQAADLVKQCKCDTKKTIDSQLKAMNDNSKATNQAAWNKAYHMQCVLDGKTTNQCTVPALPVVKAIPYGAGVEEACTPATCAGKGCCRATDNRRPDGQPCGLSSKGLKMWRSGGAGLVSARGFGFKLFKMAPQSGFSQNAAGQAKYEQLCKAHGLKMIGCGTNTYPSQNYPTRAVAMPTSWGCNMLSPLKSHTGLCTGQYTCLALQEFPDSPNYMYTPNAQNNGGRTYYPICGCEIDYDQGCSTKCITTQGDTCVRDCSGGSCA